MKKGNPKTQTKNEDWCNYYSDKLDQILDTITVSRYQEMREWQRKDLSKEELFEYAEEMRKALELIGELAYY